MLQARIIEERDGLAAGRPLYKKFRKMDKRRRNAS